MRVYEALADLDRQNQEAIDFWSKMQRESATPNDLTAEFIDKLTARGRALTAVMLEMPISLAEREI